MYDIRITYEHLTVFFVRALPYIPKNFFRQTANYFEKMRKFSDYFRIFLIKVSQAKMVIGR